MPPQQTVSTQAGARLIKDFEGFRPDAYPDPKDGWALPTIGYGTTAYANGRRVQRGDTISEPQAVAELENFVQTKILPSLQKIPHFSEMTEPMQGALESFAYNLGPNFYESNGFDTITRKLKNKEWSTMREAFMLYVNPGSNVEAGLRRRRATESSLWEQGLNEGGLTAPTPGPKPEPPKPEETFSVAKLHDFFKWYKSDNPQHIEAVTQLAQLLPEKAFRNDADWVKTYRAKPPVPVVQPGRDRILSVQYFSQRDSHTGHAMRMCFSSSNAMLVSNLKPGVLHGDNADDDYLARVLRFGDTTDAGAQLQALKSFGINAQHRTDLDWADLDQQLAKGIPIPIGILHHGPVTAPSGGGHWIIVIGKKGDDTGYFVHDPFGEMDLVAGVYISNVGERLVYSKKNLGPRWLVEGPNHGYGILADTP